MANLTLEQFLDMTVAEQKAYLANQGVDRLAKVGDALRGVAEDRKALLTQESRKAFQDELRSSIKFPTLAQDVCQAARDRGAMSINVIYDLTTGVGTPSAIYASAAKRASSGTRKASAPSTGPQKDLKATYAHATEAEKAEDQAKAKKLQEQATAAGKGDQSSNIWYNLKLAYFNRHPEFQTFKGGAAS